MRHKRLAEPDLPSRCEVVTITQIRVQISIIGSLRVKEPPEASSSLMPARGAAATGGSEQHTDDCAVNRPYRISHEKTS